MWVLLDNYDSFTYILLDYILQLGVDCKVYRNDEISLQQLIDMRPERIIISPGPETPMQSGICMDTIGHFHKTTPILGVCLGHQALGVYFGAKLVKVRPMHGKTSEVKHNGHNIFSGIPSPFIAMRYHSLALEQLDNTDLKPIAYTEDGVLMAMAHKTYPCMGVQFHPESVGTEYGLQLLKNWAKMLNEVI